VHHYEQLSHIFGLIMTEKKNPEEMSCATCAMRKRAEEKPKSLIGRFWHWHIKWCPGWKAYQEAVAEAK